MFRVTKEFKFDSAHRLEGYEGNCSHLHGHTWRLAVTLEGTYLAPSGMLMDFKLIKSVVNEIIVEELDHVYLNDVLDVNPTAENLAKYIFLKLHDVIAERSPQWVELVNVRLWENYPESYVDYFED